ncbi:MAG TPA: hypothetical protein VIM35_01640 [Gallionella sp.]|jgi:predicted permease
MKPGIRIIVVILIAAMALAVANAQAGSLTLPEREDVQAIAWTIEFLAIFTAVGIAWFIWRLSKRDQKSKNDKRHDLTRD